MAREHRYSDGKGNIRIVPFTSVEEATADQRDIDRAAKQASLPTIITVEELDARLKILEAQ